MNSKDGKYGLTFWFQGGLITDALKPYDSLSAASFYYYSRRGTAPIARVMC